MGDIWEWGILNLGGGGGGGGGGEDDCMGWGGGGGGGGGGAGGRGGGGGREIFRQLIEEGNAMLDKEKIEPEKKTLPA